MLLVIFTIQLCYASVRLLTRTVTQSTVCLGWTSHSPASTLCLPTNLRLVHPQRKPCTSTSLLLVFSEKMFLFISRMINARKLHWWPWAPLQSLGRGFATIGVMDDRSPTKFRIPEKSLTIFFNGHQSPIDTHTSLHFICILSYIYIVQSTFGLKLSYNYGIIVKQHFSWRRYLK